MILILPAPNWQRAVWMSLDQYSLDSIATKPFKLINLFGEGKLNNEMRSSVLRQGIYIYDTLILSKLWESLYGKDKWLLTFSNKYNLLMYLAMLFWGCRKAFYGSSGLHAHLEVHQNDVGSRWNMPFHQWGRSMQYYLEIFTYNSWLSDNFSRHASVLYKLRKTITNISAPLVILGGQPMKLWWIAFEE